MIIVDEYSIRLNLTTRCNKRCLHCYLEDEELINDFHNVIIKKIYQNPEVQKKINEKTKFVKLEYEGTYYDEYSFIDYFRFCPNCIWICDN